MILQKRLDYGFTGYQVPHMLRGPRSARRRRSFKNKFDDSQLCAFDLLATVAGKLLVEGEIPNCSDDKSNGNDTDEKERHFAEMSPKSKPCEKGVYKGPFFLHDPVLKVPIVNNTVKDASVRYILEDETKRNVKMEPPSFTGQVSVSHNMDMFSPVHPVALDNSAEFPCSYNNDDDENLVSRDDDEKISWCSKPSTTVNKDTRLLPRIADRRIRKILASKCWKITKRIDEKAEGQHFLADGEMKDAYPQEESCYNCQRSVRDYPFKKRKLYGRSFLSSSNMGPTCQNNMPSLAEQGYNGDARGIKSTKNGATGASAIALSQHASLQSRDSHVKLNIKSFRIPELFVEIPETATVGSLKKTVMDAVTAILSGGLRVGVLVQGKRIRDDSKTLLQTGISHDNKILDALNFVLEPSQLPEDRSLILPSHTPQPLPRYPCGPSIVQQGTGGALTEINADSAPPPRTPPNTSADKCLTKSKALVSPPLTADAPVRKPKRSDVSQQQRRIRRPFSVSEVEALVQAVEKLGTGRWRDVKLRAFDNAKQRTYVDLKDKWKTLVHTARISPQQRRGEPVPQELLDRVLTAHAYWSQHLPKHHHHLIKHHS